MEKIKELLNQRSELLSNAESLVSEGKLEEFNEIESQIKELDNQIDAAKLANANLKAMQENNKVLNKYLFEICLFLSKKDCITLVQSLNLLIFFYKST